MTPAEPTFVATLPGRYYHDPAIYALELERIFSSMWVSAGRAEALARPGSYRVVTIAKESVLVVRDREETLRAFLNVCRHRGARLCSEAAGELKGAVRCRYHAWTYGLDGRLLGAPGVVGVLGEAQVDRAALGLVPVALELWEGFVYLSLAERPAPIADQLTPSILARFGGYEPFARYGLGGLTVGRTRTYEVAANWKVLLENFLECYHCGTLHPELCALLPGFRGGKSYLDGDAATLAPGAEAFSLTGKAGRPPLKGLLPEETRRYRGEVLRPNVLLNLLSDHVVVHTVQPVAPDRSVVVCDWLFDPEVAAAPGFDPEGAVELFDVVNTQDWAICELVQQGVTSRAFAGGGVFAPAEHHVRAFADFVLERLGG